MKRHDGGECDCAAGGYTYRADRKGIMIKRTNDPEKKEVPIAEEETVMPGDVLRIPERS